MAERRCQIFKEFFDTAADILYRHWDPEDIGEFAEIVRLMGEQGIKSVIPTADPRSYFFVIPHNNAVVQPTDRYAGSPGKMEVGVSKCYLVSGQAIVLVAKKHHPFEILTQVTHGEPPVVIEGKVSLMDMDDDENNDVSVFPEVLRIVAARSASASNADSEAEAIVHAFSKDNLELIVEVGQKGTHYKH